MVRAQVEQLPERRARRGVGRLPLDGVPFAIKDNIDAAGWTTTAACPSFARVAATDAVIVARLLEAGAILIGKTNLDQSATGLVGTRSPCRYRAEFVRRREDWRWIQLGLGRRRRQGFGSLRARDRYCRIWPCSRGIPQCRGLQTDPRSLQYAGPRPSLSYARLPIHLRTYRGRCRRGRGAPRSLRSVRSLLASPRTTAPTDHSAAHRGASRASSSLAIGWPRTHSLAHAMVVEGLGLTLQPTDFRPFRELADLLYSASWVAERSLVAGDLLAGPPEALDPTVRAILLGGRSRTAEEAFAAEYRRAELARVIDRVFEQADVLMVPTTPTVYRVSEVLADPIATNARLGTYTNFTNLADLCALALPGPFRDDRFPAGVTLLARAHHERTLVDLARRLETALDLSLGATGRRRSAEEAAPSIPPSSELGDEARCPGRRGRPSLWHAAQRSAHLRARPACSERAALRLATSCGFWREQVFGVPVYFESRRLRAASRASRSSALGSAPRPGGFLPAADSRSPRTREYRTRGRDLGPGIHL